MTKFPIMLSNTKNTKKALVPPIPPPSSYEDAVGWSVIEAGYKTALRGSRKFTREAVLYDLYSEVNNVRLWRDLKKIEKTRQAGGRGDKPGKERQRIIGGPKEGRVQLPPPRGEGAGGGKPRLVIGVKKRGPVLVDQHARLIQPVIGVAADVVPALQHQDPLSAPLSQLPGTHRAGIARTHHQGVKIQFQGVSHLFLFFGDNAPCRDSIS